jgi:VIT1/CCC1 family predicted Fe2+/Mn2+ transporter
MPFLLLVSVLAAVPGASMRTVRPALGSHAEALRLRGGGSFGKAMHSATAELFAAKPRNADKVPTTPVPRRPRLEDHVRGVVFGGMDGILTTFALLAAVAGSRHTSTSLTLVIGISTVLADALSMGAGEYLSSKAEAQMEGGAAKANEPGPLEKGLAMFLAFTAFGSMPLLGFIVAAALTSLAGNEVQPAKYFLLSIVITGVTLFALGCIKAQFVDDKWWKSGLEVSGIGGAAACVAYFTARVVDHLID